MYLRRNLLFALYKLTDIPILIFALLITFYLFPQTGNFVDFEEFFSLRIKVINLIWLFGMIAVWHGLFTYFHLYQSRRLEKGTQEFKDILKATSLGTMIFWLAASLFDIVSSSPWFWSIFWLMSTILAVCCRLILLRIFLQKIRLLGKNLRFVIIVGTNRRAYDFAKIIYDKKELGYQLLGYVDENIHCPNDGTHVLGTIEEFPAILKDQVVDEVVIALPIKSCYEKIEKIVQVAEEQGIVIRYLSDLFDTKVAKPRTETIEDFSILTMSSGPLDKWQYSAKRIFDFALATALIILASPLMFFAAVAIAIDSHGPILFIQDRVGFNKRVFKLYKFRTMVVDAEKMQGELEVLNEMEGPVFKIKNDPRITTLGRWLRKLSIDELPQLFNVVKGDMSLVGPRPLPLRDYKGFTEDWQRRRVSVVPGITCIWQISGRNNVSFDDWMKMDMKYIDTWSPLRDLRIIFRTVSVVLTGNGAS